MNELKEIGLIIVAVVVSYVVLLATFGAFLGIWQGGVDALAARAGIDAYVGLLAFAKFVPWSFLFLPAIAGTIGVVMVLRRQEKE